MASEEQGLAFPGLSVRNLTDSISWRFYKHWGQGYLAGEGIAHLNGDHSGGVKMIGGLPMTNAPCVAQARLYTSARGSVSAVYSYPNGIGIMPDYFWEIYSPDGLLDEVERFATEHEMEQRIVELLDEPAAGGRGDGD